MNIETQLGTLQRQYMPTCHERPGTVHNRKVSEDSLQKLIDVDTEMA